MSPYQSVPKSRFLLRMLGPVAVAFWLGTALMGMLADPGTFVPKPFDMAMTAAPGANDVTALPRGGLNHFRTIAYFATHVPEVCWGDNAVNDFQKRQCQGFWEHLELGAGLCLLPFVVAVFFWWYMRGSLLIVYRTACRRADGGRAVARGTVTEPPYAPQDVFGFVYCLRPVSVQLEGGAQTKVYIPLDSPEPRPGETMAVFEPRQFFGELRHFGVIYAPHVAVVAGVRGA